MIKIKNVMPRKKIKEYLSDREYEVLKYVTKGLTNKEIAKKMSVTYHTVKAHVASIIKKVGVKNRLEAAMKYATNANIKTKVCS